MAQRWCDHSTDNGTTWSPVNNGLANTRVSALAVSGTNVFAGTARGVFRSTNSGASWTEANAGLPFNTRGVSAFAMSGKCLFASLYADVVLAAHGVFLSTNNGTSWTAANNGLPRYPWWDSYVAISCIASNGQNLCAGTYGGVFLSTNNGTNWTQVNSGLTDTLVNILLADRSRLFAGTSRDVFLSTNNGTSWTQTGLTNTAVNSLAVSGTDLFAGTYAGVWRRPLAEMITSVDPSVDLVPTVFKLHQNYPNPFNPTTTITYGLPRQSQVSLMVYNTLGQQVGLLVQGEQEAGYHEVRFDGTGLSSGVYFYRFQAGGFVQSKRLVLLK